MVLVSYVVVGIFGVNLMEILVVLFKIGIVVFIVLFMFFYNFVLLMDGSVLEIVWVVVIVIVGVFLFSLVV